MLAPFHGYDEPCTFACKDDPDHCPNNERVPAKIARRRRFKKQLRRGAN